MCLKKPVKSWKTLTLQKYPIEKKKYANKQFSKFLNTQLKFEIPKLMKMEWVTYEIAQKIN